MAQNNEKKSFAELPKSGTKKYTLKILKEIVTDRDIFSIETKLLKVGI